ncbi:expansin-like B1 [Rhododendron vialii]|uniref:expansin-like B1 n=1 Tax=Rhododendron vialii TaxID=182163 RepID=UPI00265F47F3|nr:expansin-like B1 [Rhododendron vialii]
MGFPHISFFHLFSTFLLMKITVGDAATCSDCFTHSRAAYYPNSDEQGTETGACGFGTFGATINGGDVSAASDLYRDGVGCGACYQVRCTNSNLCSDKGVTVVITDNGASDRTDFILSRRAFGRMAQTTDGAASLLAFGVVDIEYRRVSCSYPSKNITIKIDENSNYPHYLAFVIWYQQGKKDITAVQLCETQSFGCKLLDRSYGAVWTTSSPPSGSLSIRMLFSDDDDETWVVPVNDIPQDWTPGNTYDSGVQVNL